MILHQFVPAVHLKGVCAAAEQRRTTLYQAVQKSVRVKGSWISRVQGCLIGLEVFASIGRGQAPVKRVSVRDVLMPFFYPTQNFFFGLGAAGIKGLPEFTVEVELCFRDLTLNRLMRGGKGTSRVDRSWRRQQRLRILRNFRGTAWLGSKVSVVRPLGPFLV